MHYSVLILSILLSQSALGRILLPQSKLRVAPRSNTTQLRQEYIRRPMRRFHRSWKPLSYSSTQKAKSQGPSPAADSSGDYASAYVKNLHKQICASTKCKEKDATIRSGDHRAKGGSRGLFKKKDIEYFVKFDDSAIYDIGGDEYQMDTNKLLGFSDCFSHHHRNSARFGWRWNKVKQQLEILAYNYVKKDRTIQLLGSVPLNKWNYYKIRVGKRTYTFTLNDKEFVFERRCKSRRANGYQLAPYFGGQKKAPHDIKIKMIKVK